MLLDLSRYWTHRAFHSVPFLWRIHEVHHSDPDYDVSTAGRFHPAEVLLEQAGYLLAIAILAPPVIAVFASELIALVLNLFAHANASLPGSLEGALRLAIITPDLHRIHHSEEVQEQQTNFGQTFTCWDRWFGTLANASATGEKERNTGIRELRNSGSLRLRFTLSEPFRRRTRQDPA